MSQSEINRKLSHSVAAGDDFENIENATVLSHSSHSFPLKPQKIKN